MNYVSLHNHTYASNIRFLDSINWPSEMVNKAISLGFSGIAFTDHEALCAAVAILKVRDAIKEKHPDFKIIFGNEIYLIDAASMPKAEKYYHFILLAKDAVGWEQLKTLSSRAWDRSYVEKGIVRTPTTYDDIEEVVGADPGHIFASTACLGGELPTRILQHDVSGANAFVKWCIGVFGQDNFALELQPSDNEEQILVNKTLIKFAKYYSVPYIITTDSHYLDKEDFQIHSAFLNSRHSSDRETEKFYKYTYVMSEDEMREILLAGGLTDDEIDCGIANTALIANSIETFDFRHDTIVPQIVIPDFTLEYSLEGGAKYPLIEKYYNSTDPQDTYLMYQIEQGIANKQIVLDDVKLDRINTELDVLDYISQRLGQNLSAYLNLTVNIVDIAWQVSLCGCGRGSACGFYINYLIGITQADPLKYDLPYWRFLNKERAELPDVDEDFQPEKTKAIIALLREAYGENNVLNCATFKTESLKSAILSAGRGLGFNNDDMQALAGMVPVHRGQTYTLKECLEGDEEKGFEPVPGFEAKLNCYPGLFDAVRKIEGLPTNASIHASALYVFNHGYLAQNSLMRAPNKTKITAFSMHDSDDMGALKADLLRTDAQSKMAKCLSLLLKDGQIEWQGDLRSTYNKYLHPDVLDYDNPDMWARMADGSILNLFQFDTQVGAVCIKKARPVNVVQLAEINSIMRLQSDGGEQPIDRYVRFRNNPEAWDLEMIEEGLSLHEIDILKKYLSGSNGVSGSQEVLMRILMDPEITGFTLGAANLARKAIAKKQAAKLIQLKKDFYSCGDQTGAREAFLNYVWKYCIEPQLGYSFSLNHTLPYSIIAVQEANLATRWNPLYWQCACLCVNAGNYANDVGGEEEEEVEAESEAAETEEEVVEEEATKEKRVAPNYGKIAKAITSAQLSGVNIDLPDINESQIDFVPDVTRNSILYSLQTVNVVSPDLLNRIMANRPYSSVEEFVEKVSPSQIQMLGLIKAGCFDSLVGKPRRTILYDYLQSVADEEFPLRDKLTSVQVKKALELGVDLPDYHTEIRIFKFRQYIAKNCVQSGSKRYVLKDDACLKFFNAFIAPKLDLSKSEYEFLPDNAIGIKQSAFERVYTQLTKPLMDYMNTDEGRRSYQKAVQEDFIRGLMEKYCAGSVSKWELDTMCFYHGPHELSMVQNAAYGICDFNALPEFPKDKPSICAIAGTVIDTKNMRHTISLLTVYGVVDVKFSSTLYTQFNQTFSTIDTKTGKKTVVDESWFKRGTKIVVYGYRRENMFCCRADRAAGRAPRYVGLIEEVAADGAMTLRYFRNKK